MSACIIIGNGPSLLDVPISFLNSLPTYGGNYIGRHHQPTYYICIDKKVIVNPEIYDTAKAAKVAYLRAFFSDDPRPPVYDLPNVELVTRDSHKWVGETKTTGCTFVYVALKIALPIFDTVYLVGVDHNDGHFYPNGENPNALIMSVREYHYRLARTMYNRANKRIINLSPASALDSIFEFERPALYGRKV